MAIILVDDGHKEKYYSGDGVAVLTRDVLIKGSLEWEGTDW